MREIGDLELLSADQARERRRLVMRTRQQSIQQPELGEEVEGRGMHRIAAEIPQEIAMLLQHEGLHPGPREEQTGHHPRRAAADNQQIGVSHGLQLGVDS